MSVVIVTGSAGLIGSEAALHFADLGHDIVGVDNDMRATFFGAAASTAWNVERLRNQLGDRYRHHALDIRDRSAIDELVAGAGPDVRAIIHTAAQPSHDWAAREPFTDFDINAVGTLNVLEAARRHVPEAPFVFTSTNKVYGDRPNFLPLVERDTRYELEEPHEWAGGIDETMPIDATLHSLFGASKVAADVLVQEYGRYFAMPTACFRGGTLTGPQHAATELHGFLGYVMLCTMAGKPYSIFGYQGKQVRDAIHSSDLVRAFEHFVEAPKAAAVYNIGGGRHSHCSVLEAIDLCESIAGRKLDATYVDEARIGDHQWWVGSNATFEADYPAWRQEYDVPAILTEMFEQNKDRWS